MGFLACPMQHLGASVPTWTDRLRSGSRWGQALRMAKNDNLTDTAENPTLAPSLHSLERGKDVPTINPCSDLLNQLPRCCAELVTLIVNIFLAVAQRKL